MEYEKQRYNLPASMRTGPLQEDAEAAEGGGAGTPEPAAKKQRISKGSAAAKKGAAQEAPARPVHKDDIVQWRTNWEEFDRRFRCMCSWPLKPGAGMLRRAGWLLLLSKFCTFKRLVTLSAR